MSKGVKDAKVITRNKQKKMSFDGGEFSLYNLHNAVDKGYWNKNHFPEIVNNELIKLFDYIPSKNSSIPIEKPKTDYEKYI